MKMPQRIAIVHEWLTTMRGGERVLEALCELFPNADIHTLVHEPGSVSASIERMSINTSFIQRLPFAASAFRYYLPLFPHAARGMIRKRYDLVISSHHCVAKGVQAGAGTLHICYCHTPMRYLWDLYDEYFSPGRSGLITRMGARLFREYLRRWDVSTAGNPHSFIANSKYVRERIRNIYHRDADVIYPPVDVASFDFSGEDKGYFLLAGALVPYKRADVAVSAFNENGMKLVVAGDGPELTRLMEIAGPGVDFRGRVTDRTLRELYAGCRALVFPGEEDFGIVPLEAMATGKPVIAYAKGGALETVIQNETGILFNEQSPSALNRAIGEFIARGFPPERLREHAMKFDKKIFKSKMKGYIRQRWLEFNESLPLREATR